jgi:hypothetical protein
LEIMVTDWRLRRVVIEEFFQTNNAQQAKNFLEENKIKYLYLVDGQSFQFVETKLKLIKIFENDLVKIFQNSNE